MADHLRGKTLKILPTALCVEEELLAQASQTGVVFNGKVTTFPQLFSILYAEMADKPPPLSRMEQRVLVREVLEAMGNDCSETTFFQCIGYVGFVDGLVRFISEVKGAGITPQAFGEIAETSSQEGSERTTFLARFYALYENMREKLKVIDPGDASRSVKEALENHSRRFRFLRGIEAFRVEHISDFAPLQFEATVALAQRIRTTCICIPYVHERADLFRYTEATIQKFESLWNLNADLELEFAAPCAADAAAPIKAILKTLLTTDEGEDGGESLVEGSLKIIGAPGRYREVEEIGREIRKLIDAGEDPAGVGVLFRDISLYGEIVEDVFRRYRIPLRFRRGRPLLSNSLVKAVLGIFDVLRDRFSRDSLLKLLTSSYFTFLDGPPESPTTRELESLAMEAHVLDDRGMGWKGRLDRLKTRLERGASMATDSRQVEKLKAKLKKLTWTCERIDTVKGQLEALRRSKALIKHVEAVEAFLESWGLYDNVLGSKNDRLVHRDVGSLREFITILRSLKALSLRLDFKARKIPFEDFHELLMEGCREASLPFQRGHGAGVRVLNVYESRGLAFDTLFIGGLIDEEFPSKVRQDPLFRDEDKLACNRALKSKVFRLSTDRLDEEPLLFYLAMSCARRRVILSYSTLDGKGNVLLPSYYVSHMLQLCEGHEPPVHVVYDPGQVTVPLNRCCEQEELENRVAYELWQPGHLGEEDLVAAVYNECVSNEPLRRRLEKILTAAETEDLRERFFLEEDPLSRAAGAGIYTGQMAATASKTRLGERFRGGSWMWSPSHLEEYGQCPFRFFLRTVLGLEPIREPAEELALDREGMLLHEILKTFFTEARGAGRLPLEGNAQDKTAMAGVATKTFERWEKEQYIGRQSLWEVTKRKLKATLMRVLYYEAQVEARGQIPSLFELSFGDARSATVKAGHTVTFDDFSGRPVKLGGKVDRIDLTERGFVVIDYKNSADAARYGELLNEMSLGVTSFQIPVYLLAARSYLTRGWDQGTFYLLRTPKLLRPAEIKDLESFLETDVEKRRELAARGVKNLPNQICGVIDRITAGQFSTNPQSCSFCPFAHICRYVDLGLTFEEETRTGS